MYRLVLSIELGTVQTGTGKVDPARKFKCITAARGVIVSLTIYPTLVVNQDFSYLEFQNQAKNISVALTSFRIKIWGKSVKGFHSYDQKNQQTNNFIYRYIPEALYNKVRGGGGTGEGEGEGPAGIGGGGGSSPGS